MSSSSVFVLLVLIPWHCATPDAATSSTPGSHSPLKHNSRCINVLLIKQRNSSSWIMEGADDQCLQLTSQSSSEERNQDNSLTCATPTATGNVDKQTDMESRRDSVEEEMDTLPSPSAGDQRGEGDMGMSERTQEDHNEPGEGPTGPGEGPGEVGVDDTEMQDVSENRDETMEVDMEEEKEEIGGEEEKKKEEEEEEIEGEEEKKKEEEEEEEIEGEEEKKEGIEGEEEKKKEEEEEEIEGEKEKKEEEEGEIEGREEKKEEAEGGEEEKKKEEEEEKIEGEKEKKEEEEEGKNESLIFSSEGEEEEEGEGEEDILGIAIQEDEEEFRTMQQFPRTLEEFRYKFNEDGELRHVETNKRYIFEIKKRDRAYNQAYYEALGDVITNEVYELLETKTKLKRIEVPVDDAKFNSGEPKSFFFMSEDALTNPDKLLVLIHGSGAVRAGQWARSLIINDNLKSGTQIPYIERGMTEGYGIIVLNTNNNYGEMEGKQYPIRDNASPEEHADYVWKHFIEKSKAKKIDIVAHSFGGVVTVHLVCQHFGTFLQRGGKVAFTDSVHFLESHRVKKKMKSWMIKNSVNWVSSSDELDSPQSYYDIKRISAGTNKHVETSWFAFESVFKFLTKKQDEKHVSTTHTRKREHTSPESNKEPRSGGASP